AAPATAPPRRLRHPHVRPDRGMGMTALVVVFSVLFVAGVAIAVMPASTPASDTPSAPTDPRRTRRLATRVLGGLASGTLIVLVSGWLLPGVVVGVGAAAAIGGWQRRQ